MTLSPKKALSSLTTCMATKELVLWRISFSPSIARSINRVRLGLQRALNQGLRVLSELARRNIGRQMPGKVSLDDFPVYSFILVDLVPNR